MANLLDIVSQSYPNVELSPGLTAFWKEALKDLSPMQIRDGLMGYMKSERGSFRPVPADIIGHAPEANDKPRKVKDPTCKECSGSGFRAVLVDSKVHVGQKARKVTDCYCVSIEYAGQTFQVEQKALPSAPEIPAEELLERIANKTGVALAAKGFPERREQSETDYNKRTRFLKEQEIQLKGGAKA